MPEFSQLLEIAQENGLNILSQADLEEVGPVDAVQIAPNGCGIGKRSDQAQSSATGGTAGHIEGEAKY